jgi:endonuclease/exonuclease/phosphatase family metal-dependent hydrolase
MKLLQLNVWGGRMEPQIAELMRTEQPDIVCLQEAISFSGEGSGLFITVENIQELTGLSYAAFAPVFSFSYMKSIAKFGNCILSRFPIEETKTVFTYLEHKDNFMWGEDSANVRNFVHTKLDVNGTVCHVVTHHGFWVPDHKNGNDETLRQTKIIADYCEGLDGAVLLTGDFNLVPDSGSIQQINKVLTNQTLEHKLKTTRTSLTHKTEACDYIFTSHDVRVSNFEALDKLASDHKALVLEFEL